MTHQLDTKKITKDCLWCKQTVNTTKSKIEKGLGKFCSQICYWKSKKGKPSPKKQNITGTCVVCGAEKIMNKTRLKSFRTCSPECRKIHTSRRIISEVTRDKLRKAQKGKERPWLHTPEAIEKMRLKKIGMPSWNKGKPWPLEYKQKRSEKYTKINLIDILAKRNYKLLSPYVNTHTPIKMECDKGHTFINTPSHIKSGQSCPNCQNVNKSEEICRCFFEGMFKQKFPNTRPSWLIGTRGHRIELDGYSETLKLAFEYQGKQHYEHNDFFHREHSLEDRKQNDKIKKDTCDAREITLIEVPITIPLDKMQEYIIAQCQNKHIYPVDTTKLDYNNFEIFSNNKKLKEIQDISISKGGLCLSETYINNSTPLKFKCAHKHTWTTIPYSIKKGTWCRKCAGLEKGTIEEMQTIASSKGGECLSKTYVNSQTHLRFKCECGYEWNAMPCNIKQGKWCPKCKGKKAWRTRRMNHPKLAFPNNAIII